MPKLLESLYTRYQLSEEEVKQATSFTLLQMQFLQNELAITAEEKITTTYDPLNPVAFAQREAELAGKIGILQYLLELGKAHYLDLDSSNNTQNT